MERQPFLCWIPAFAGMTEGMPMTAAPDSPLATLWCPAANREPRRDGRVPDMLVLHYTGMEFLRRGARLADPGRVEGLLPLPCRRGRTHRPRWCAVRNAPGMPGKACGPARPNLNSCSIGIEIHNPGHEFGYRDFPRRKCEAWRRSASTSCAATPSGAERVVAHSDIAGTQARSWREIRLGAARASRRRALGRARAIGARTRASVPAMKGERC